MMGRSRVLALLTVVAMTVSAAAVSAQQDEKKRSKEEQKEIEQLVTLVDGVMKGETPAPTAIQLKLEPFFLKSQETRTFVPFVLSVSGAPAADAAMYVRVVNPTPAGAAQGDDEKDKDEDKDKDKDEDQPEYPWDDIHFIPAAQLQGGAAHLARVFMAEPGTYDVYIALKERLPEKAPKDQVAKAGVIKTQVTVPDFSNGELATSSVLVTDTVNELTAPLSPEEARERPFVFGPQELVPAVDMSFKKSAQLSIFYQVYNSGLDAQGKPDLVMEYNFHKKEGDGEKFFNKTNPTTINASNLPPTFDPQKFPVPGGITVPLSTFGAGDYRLEIKITDKAGGKTLTRDVNFTVTAD